MLFDHSRGAAEVTAGKKSRLGFPAKKMFDQEGGSDKKGVSPHLLLLRGREGNRDFAPKRFFERKGGGCLLAPNTGGGGGGQFPPKREVFANLMV